MSLSLSLSLSLSSSSSAAVQNDSIFQRFKEMARKALLCKKSGTIISYAEEPGLAAICTVLGLYYEISQPGIDRLSVFLGRDPETYETPWQKSIFIHNDKIGLCLKPRDGKQLLPRHVDIGRVIHSASLNNSGDLDQVIVFPKDIAVAYSNLGIELVIVRDWALTSFLAEESKAINYLVLNGYEVAANTALQQIPMILKGQLAFSGTHDISDHLLGASQQGLQNAREFADEIKSIYDRVFHVQNHQSKQALMYSYVVGVILDDLVQPRWYGSEGHKLVARYFCAKLAQTPVEKNYSSLNDLKPPKEMDQLVTSLRSQKLDKFNLIRQCNNLIAAIH